MRRQGTFTLLDPEPADYPAEFLFTNDLKWIVREQKIGSGTSTLYLYRLASNGHIPARFRQQTSDACRHSAATCNAKTDCGNRR